MMIILLLKFTEFSRESLAFVNGRGGCQTIQLKNIDEKYEEIGAGGTYNNKNFREEYWNMRKSFDTKWYKRESLI